MTAVGPDDSLSNGRAVEVAARGCRATVQSDGQGCSASSEAEAPPRCAQLIPFPVARRRSFVCKLAEQVAARSRAAGEVHLLQQLRRQGEVLRRKSVPESLIERELLSVAAAVRAEL